MGKKRKTRDELLSDFEKVHGNCYDYSLVDYSVATNKVKIRCKKHDYIFEQLPYDHRDGSGCPICGLERRSKKCSKPLSYYIQQADKHFAGMYDYSLVPDAAIGQTVVDIVCKKCGKIFSQKLSKHAEGNGCNKCQANGFCEGKPGYVYLLNSGDMFKVGITNRKIEKRITEVKKKSNDNWIVLDKFLTDGYLCRQLETLLLETFQNKDNLVSDVFSGYTETFYCDDAEYVTTTFKSIVKDCPSLGELPFVKPPTRILETPEIRRKRLEEKTGVPVGVVRKNEKWYFQEVVRVNGVKDKKPHAAFESLEDCCAFARHYWNTGELLTTNKNLLTHNKYQLPNGITPCFGGFRVQFGYYHKKYYIGTFQTLDLAIDALQNKKKELFNGEN